MQEPRVQAVLPASWLRARVAGLRLGDPGSLTGFVARAASATLLIKIATSGLSFAINLELGRLLGAGGYGDYGVAISWMGLGLILARLGLDRVVLRETAGAWARRDWGLVRGVFGFVVAATLAASALVATIGAGLAFGAYYSHPALRDAVLVAMGMLIVVAVQGQVASAVLGRHAVARAQLPELLALAGFAAALGAATLRRAPAPSPAAILSIQAAISLAGLAAALFFWRRLTPREVRAARPVRHVRSWLLAGVPFMLSGGATVVNYNADILVLQGFAGSDAAGVYRAATRGAMFVPIGMLLLQPALSPVFAALHAAGEKARLQRAAAQASRVGCVLGFAVALPLMLAGGWFLRLFGPEFVAGASALRILALGQLVFTAAGASSVLAAMAGGERDLAAAAVIGVLLNLALILVLIPLYGANGAAIGTAVSTAAATLFLVYRSQRRLDIDPSVFGSPILGRSRP